MKVSTVHMPRQKSITSISKNKTLMVKHVVKNTGRHVLATFYVQVVTYSLSNFKERSGSRTLTTIGAVEAPERPEHFCY